MRAGIGLITTITTTQTNKQTKKQLNRLINESSAEKKWTKRQKGISDFAVV